MTAPLSSLTATWDNAGTTFNAIGMDVTDTGHAAASRLLKLSVNGATQFDIDADGVVKTGEWQGTAIGVSYGGTGATSASAARTALGLAIGSDVQAYDADLAAIAGLTSAADKLPYFTGSGTASLADFTAFGRSLVDDANASAARTTLGLAIGTDVQAHGAVLDDLNTLGANTADGEFLVGTGAGALAWESGATARTSLGLGSLATASTISNDNWSGTDLEIANGGTGASTASAARTALGVEIGTDVQAFNALLSDIAGLTVAQGDILYVNGTGDIANLGAGTSGQFLQTNGAGANPSWETPAGSGNVSNSGTPVDGQIAIWTGATNIEGDAALTFDTTTDTLVIGASGNLAFGAVTILADSAGTLTLQNVDALDATTEATIEAAIDTLANLTSIQGVTVTLADAGANALFGWDDVAGAYENLTQSEALDVLGLNTTDSPQFTGIELGHATDTTITRAGAGQIAVEGVNVLMNGGALGTPSSGTLTNATGLPISTGVSGLGTGVATMLATPTAANFNSALSDGTFRTAGADTIWIPATAMTTRTTSGAAAGSSETTTNKIMVETYDFDAASDEFVQFSVAFPKSWNEGTITAQFVWSTAATTGNVVWAIQGLALADDDALDTAFGTAQTVTDGASAAANDVLVSSATSAVTIAGTPSTDELVYFQVYRDADNGSDTMSGDAKLIGVKIIYTTDASNDN